MNKIKAFFKLIRWSNLLIILLTQYFVWQFVIQPLNIWSEIPVFLNFPNFLILSCSTIFIAAAGYIINDYFDVKIDLINKPEKVIIEKIINRRAAIIWHSFLNFSGLGLSLYLALQLGNIWVWGIHVLCTILLWFYSTKFKREFVSGNILVALLTALTILIVCFYEPTVYPYFKLDMFVDRENRIINPVAVILVYAFFAFILTWMREIVKDMEDFKGDLEDGCKTMPIKLGLQKSGYFVIQLAIVGILLLSAASFKLIAGNWSILGLYIIITLMFPLMYFIYFLPKKANSKHYFKASRLLKIIMIFGILSLTIYYILQFTT